MTATAPPVLVGLGRFFMMSAGALRAIPRGVHLAELLEQTVFIAKVSLLPVIFVTIPLTVVVQFFIGQLLAAIGAQDLASTWRRIFPDLKALADLTGWSQDAMELILDSFSRATLKFSFVTRGAVLETLPESFVSARFVSSGDYPLSERCPFLVAIRAA